MFFIKWTDYVEEVNWPLLPPGFITKVQLQGKHAVRNGKDLTTKPHSTNQFPMASKAKIITQEIHIWPR